MKSLQGSFLGPQQIEGQKGGQVGQTENIHPPHSCQDGGEQSWLTVPLQQPLRFPTHVLT